MTLVFDTTALSQLLDSNDRVAQKLSEVHYDRLIIPLATDAEVRYGFKNGKKNEKNLTAYENVKQALGLEITAPDQDTALIYADIATWCKQNGLVLSNNDIWIAATSIQFGGTLISLDQDFKNLPQLRLVKF